MIDFVVLLLGLAGLWAGTELTLGGAMRLSERLGLSQGFVGLAVLAIGTDLPELVVAIRGGIAQLQGVDSSGLIVGNAVGSAITQGTLVLGIAGVFGIPQLARRSVWRDGIALFAATAALWLVASNGNVTRFEGGVLFALYLAYLATLTRSERVGSKLREGGRDDRWRITGLLVGGLTLVAFASELVVTHAVALADGLGVDSAWIGIFIIGAGTSLPELALSLGAVAKGRVGLSVGNVIGSNLFDLLVPVGASAAIHPLNVERATLWVDIPFVALATAVALACLARVQGLQRRGAIGLIVLYFLFAVLRLAFFA